MSTWELPADCGLIASYDADVVTITLNDPDRRNPQTPATWQALRRIAADLPGDCVAVILRGAGGSFSAGLDRRMLTPDGVPGQGSFVDIARLPAAQIDERIAEMQAAFVDLRTMRPVTIALVQGHAVGAGFQLALAADLLIVSKDVQLSLKEPRLGLVPDLTGTHALVRAVGYTRALEICLTGRPIGGAEAVRLGLAIDCVESGELQTAALALVESVRSAPFGAALAVKSLLRAAETVDPATQNAHERAAQVIQLQTMARALGQGA